MKTLLALLLVLTLDGLLFAQTMVFSPSRPLVFTHVTVIDVTGGPSKSDMTVGVVGNRIVSVGRAGKVRIQRDAQIIEADGKFLIPGLWDMHVHTLWKERIDMFFPLFIANGVTGVRDMGSAMPFEQINQLRKEIEEGKLLGPRIFAGGQIVDGPDPAGSGSSIIVVTNEAEARRTVDSLKRQGADFIKVYNNLSREAYFAIAAESKKIGIPFVGHIPFSIGAAEASDAGQKSFEHMGHPFGGVLVSCSNKETEIRKEWIEAATKSSNIGVFMGSIPEILGSYNEDKAKQLIRKLAKNGTWQCPTFVVFREFSIFKPLYQKNLALAGEMNQFGVQFLAGTDTSSSLAPGSSLHDELELLVAAGLSPIEALRSATLNPAKFLGREKELGTVEKGKIADLVLLDADPLENINNTRRIAAVIVNGRYLSKELLQKMGKDTKATAN